MWCRGGSAACFLSSSRRASAERDARRPSRGRRRRRRRRQSPPRAPMRPERPRPRSSVPGPMEVPPWGPLRNDSLQPTLTPAVPPYVKLGLTIVYTVFYSLLFVFIYVQLWLVLRYRHKRLSYQSVFLFLCLFWASLRTVLFSFYFKDFVAANALSPFVFWLLYCFPVCLQFFTLTLMNLYFTQVSISEEAVLGPAETDSWEGFKNADSLVHPRPDRFSSLKVIFKAKSKYSPELLKYRLPLHLASLSVSLIFLLVNLTCAVLVKTGDWERRAIVSVRVAINDTLFVLCAISLSICLYKISKMSLANIYLESKGSSVCQVTAIGVTVILLYTSRACYNLFILSFSQSKNVHSFDYDWYNVSDQADLKNQLGDAGYVVFGVVLFVWELLPTTLVVYFFRVRNSTKDLTNPGMVPSHGFSPRSYFFDNPRRYDSDDDLAWNIAPQGLQGRQCQNEVGEEYLPHGDRGSI
ncbi:integral membrane protein GPR137B isoform X2 [Manis javanica]|uniref:integral membrane protein GPR137B isoform X2 n=1 Tax=Manis javanica TaxID=9974 RepID=UPI003C6D00F4